MAAHKALVQCKIEDAGGNRFKIVLKNGKAIQIRKACDEAGVKISDLLRMRVGDIKLEALEAGTWRALTDEELKALSY